MNEFIKSVISGITIAITWALLVLIVNYLRNIYLERKIRKTFKTKTYSYGVDGWGLELHNMTKVSVKIREVSLTFDNNYTYLAAFSGRKMVTRVIKSSIGNNKKYKTYNTKFDFEDQKGERIIKLDSEISGKWIISNKLCYESEGIPVGGTIIVEYPCILGWKKTIFLPIENSDLLRGTFKHHVKECRENDFMKKYIES